MKLFIAALLVTSVIAFPNLESRVASGFNGTAGLVKCYVSMLIEGEFSSKTCGGCFLAEDKIVTAASCVNWPSEGIVSTIRFYSALTGPAGAESPYQVQKIYVENSFDPSLNTSDNDVAIIALKNRVPTTATFAPTNPSKEDDLDAFLGEDLVVCGHGYIDNNRTKPAARGLQCTTLTVVPSWQCLEAIPTTTGYPTTTYPNYDDTTTNPNGWTTTPRYSKSFICTKNSDERNVCGGDTGSPVFSNYTGNLALVGVVSFYPNTRPNTRCEGGHMVVITQLGSFQGFLNNPANQPTTPKPWTTQQWTTTTGV